MEMLVAARVKALEDGLLRLQEQVGKTIEELAEIKIIAAKQESKEEPVPEDFITLADFQNLYKFISGPGLGSLLAEAPELWAPHHCRSGRNVYVRPLFVIEYLMNPPEGKAKHTRIYNQLIRWRKFHPEIESLWDKWKIWRADEELKKKPSAKSTEDIQDYFEQLFPKLRPTSGDNNVS